MFRPVLWLSSMARSGISSLANQPYRLPPTVDMASPEWIVQLATFPPPLSRMSMSTARKPASSRNVCRNVYQPDVVIWTGVRQEFGVVDGFGQGFWGKAPLRKALVLALMKNPGGLGSIVRLVPALKTKSLRNVPADVLIAELKSNRTSG